MRTRLLLSLLSFLTIVVTALPALAAQDPDPNDAAGPLDLSLIRVNQEDNGVLHVRIETYGAWKKGIVAKDNPNRWTVFFDTDSDGTSEYHGRILYTNGDLVLHLKGQGSTFEPLPVQKPDARTLKFTIPGGAPMNPTGVGVATKTTFVGPDNTYFDRAPDGGFLTDV